MSPIVSSSKIAKIAIAEIAIAEIAKKVKRISLVAALLAFALAAVAEGATRYVVTDEILPVMMNPGDPYVLEGGVIRPAEGGARPHGSVVYGNFLDVEHIRGKYSGSWVRLLSARDGVTIGYVETKGLTARPKYDALDGVQYLVIEDEPDLRLMPGSAGERLRAASRGFRLIKGEVVRAFGRINTGGAEWILLGFSSDTSVGGDPGVGMRYLWAPAGSLMRLADYAPDTTRNEDQWVPRLTREFGGPETPHLRETAMPGIRELSSGLRTRLLLDGFRIDMEPALPAGQVETDDIADLCRDTAAYSPDFITSDMLSRSYFVLFDLVQRDAERQIFAPRLIAALKSALGALSSAPVPSALNGAFDLARDMLSIPLCLLGGVPEADLSERARAEVARVTAASARVESPFADGTEDYSAYRPDGHYEGDAALERYFRAVTFLSRARLRLFEPDGRVYGRGAASAVMIALALEADQGAWERFREPVDYLLGTVEDSSYRDIRASALARVKSLDDVASLADAKLLETVAIEARSRMGRPRSHGLELRLWGRRREGAPAALPDEPEPVTPAAPDEPASEDARPPAAQVFLASDAWKIKRTLTDAAIEVERSRSGSLYSGHAAAEVDREDARSAAPYAPPSPRGYVEPDPASFRTVTEDADRLRRFVAHYSLDTAVGVDYGDRLGRLAALAREAARIADAELSGAAITTDDYAAIKEIARSLGRGLLTDGGGERRGMAATGPAATAIGAPSAIYVFVNDRSGGPRLAKGWIYSCYDIGASRAMSDDDWRDMVYDPARASELKALRPHWYSGLE